MNILIIETRKCHLEILPTWAKLLSPHQLTFWIHRRTTKLDIAPLLNEIQNVKLRTSLFRPLTKKHHYEAIRKAGYDLIILNSAETNHPDITPQTIFAETGLPVIALCHRKQNADQILEAAHPHITACTLSPQLSDPAHTLYAVHYSDQLPSPTSVAEGLKLVIPGMVSPLRRHYPFITELHKHLQPNDKVTILGSCSSRYKAEFNRILEQCPQATHIHNAKPFPPFMNHIASSHAILSLVEPEMERFSEYTNELISGSVNLSLGLNKPVLGNSQYLQHVSQLNSKNSISYTPQTIKDAIQRLRASYPSLVQQLRHDQELLLSLSQTNIETLIQHVG